MQRHKRLQLCGASLCKKHSVYLDFEGVVYNKHNIYNDLEPWYAKRIELKMIWSPGFAKLVVFIMT
jgi:hypothetical protein